jgi:hypothetical protein
MNDYLLAEYVHQRGQDLARVLQSPDRRAAADVRIRRGTRRRRWAR